MLEISSGTGHHTKELAQLFPKVQFQPSEIEESLLESVRAHIVKFKLQNVAAPVKINVIDEDWPLSDTYDAMLNINMLHISPRATLPGIMRGAGKHLNKNAIFFIYGPFKVDNKFTTPSNEQFDRSLKSRNSEWGLRDLAEVESEAEKNGLKLVEKQDMPSNNFMLMFEKQ